MPFLYLRHLILTGHFHDPSDHHYYYYFQLHFRLLFLLLHALLATPHVTRPCLPAKYRSWQDPAHLLPPAPSHKHIRAYSLLSPYICLFPHLLSACCKTASGSAAVWKQAVHRRRYIKKRDIRSQLPEASLFFFRSYSFYDSSVTIPRLLFTSYEAGLQVMSHKLHITADFVRRHNRDEICSANLALISGRRHNKKRTVMRKTFFQTLFAYGSFLLLCSDQLQLSKCCCDDCHRIYFRSVTSTGQIVDWCI